MATIITRTLLTVLAAARRLWSRVVETGSSICEVAHAAAMVLLLALIL